MGEIKWNCWDGGFPSTLTKGHSMGPILGGSNNVNVWVTLRDFPSNCALFELVLQWSVLTLGSDV